jgi:hypothetical protein
MSEALPVVGRGFCYEDLKVGFSLPHAPPHDRGVGRLELRQPDLADRRAVRRRRRRAARDQGARGPGALVYAFAEGLLLPTMQDTGLAFLNATLDIKAPTVVGDTIHVESEVLEARLTSKATAAWCASATRSSTSAAKPCSSTTRCGC